MSECARDLVAVFLLRFMRSFAPDLPFALLFPKIRYKNLRGEGVNI